MQQPDVLNRALLLPLEPIAPEDRKSETAVLTEFERLRPSLFGALLDILTRTLRELPQVKLDTVPRMADFARVGVAVERALGWEAGTFLRAYTANIAEQHMEALAASPVAETIITFMEERPNWEGTAGNLLDELTALIGETKAKAKDWPKTPRGLAGHLKRIAPNLRGVGIWVKEATPQGHDRKRVLSIVNKSLSPESRGIQPSASSAPSVPISNEQESADDWPLMRTVDRPQASQPSAGQSSFQSQADDADDADGSAATFSNTALDDLEGDGPEMEL
jgi:hypothetical protein